MRVTLRMLSIAFDYPRGELKEMVGKREFIRRLIESEDKRVAEEFYRFLESLNPETLEEDYTSVFEVPPKCSLYAHTYLLKGKEDLVGQFLLEVKGHYKLAGLDVPVKRELPTYLPVMLEFLSIAVDISPEEAARFARRYLKPWVGELERCLERNRSPWARAAKALRLAIESLANPNR